MATPGYRPPGSDSDRHAAFALDLVEAFDADDHVGASELHKRNPTMQNAIPPGR